MLTWTALHIYGHLYLKNLCRVSLIPVGKGRRTLGPRLITPLPVWERQLPKMIRGELLGADWPNTQPGSSRTTRLNNKSSLAGSSQYPPPPPSYSHQSQIMSKSITVRETHSGLRRMLPALALCLGQMEQCRQVKKNPQKSIKTVFRQKKIETNDKYLKSQAFACGNSVLEIPICTCCTCALTGFSSVSDELGRAGVNFSCHVKQKPLFATLQNSETH